MDNKGNYGIWGTLGVFILGMMIGGALMTQPGVRNAALEIGREIESTITGSNPDSILTVQELIEDPNQYEAEKVTVEGELRIEEGDNVVIQEKDTYIKIADFEDAEKSSEIVENTNISAIVTGIFYAPRKIYAHNVKGK